MAAPRRVASVVSAAQAKALDEALFSTYGFRVEQLVELAGLAVALATARYFAKARGERVLVVCGPGHNGADGLVAARHLALFGFRPALLYPRRPQSALFAALLLQCRRCGVDVLERAPDAEAAAGEFALALDALFGFGFAGAVREPLAPALALLAALSARRPLVSVDVPSGWPVDGAPPPPRGERLEPALLVSLSAPKPCSRHLRRDARHVLGGRFLPPALVRELGLELPPFPDEDLFVELSPPDDSSQ